jgi:hypothetical protein
LKEAIYRQPLLFTDGGDIQIELDWTERLKYRWSPHLIGEGYTFYRFDLKKDLHILWSNDREFKINLFGKPTRVYDRYGKEKRIEVSNGNPLSLQLSSDPIIIERDK